MLGVAAAVYAFERREIIRQTWGTYAESENVKVLFFQVGVPFGTLTLIFQTCQNCWLLPRTLASFLCWR